jgi:hypothetical protein
MQEGNPLLAYVFWHCQQAEIAATGYENRQRAFHAVLAAVPSSGFLGSFSLRLSHVPWAAGGGDAYEDWYLVQDFRALGLLNEAAVSETVERHRMTQRRLSRLVVPGACTVCSTEPRCDSHSTPIGSANQMACSIVHSSRSSRL